MVDNIGYQTYSCFIRHNMPDTKRKYISLKEASESCDYSQEYLSLRARQGKLKAVKFGRNWVTTKEWLEEYLIAAIEHNNNHKNSEQKIFNPPTNLPIREDLLESSSKTESYGSHEWDILDFSLGKILTGFKRFKNSLQPELKIRFSYIAFLALSLLVTNVVFGQKSIRNVYSQYTNFTQEVSEKFDKEIIALVDIRVPELINSTSLYVEGSINKTEDAIYNQLANLTNSYTDAKDSFVTTEKQIYQELSNKSESIGNFVQTTINDYINSDKLTNQDTSSGSVGTKDYFISLFSKVLNNYVIADKLIDGIFVKALSDTGNYIKNIVNNSVQLYVNADKNFDKKFFSINEFFARALSGVNNYVKGIVNNGVQLYVDADKSLDEKVFDLGKKMRAGLQFVISPWQGGRVVSLESTEDIQNIKNEIAKIKEEGLPVKEIEVSRITRIEPIKEITKEVIKVNDASLALMEARVASLEKNIVDRLYAPNGVVSQMVYITQPLASPKFYQENGDIVLQTVGSGSVIISAATGAQISGQQVMIDSTDARNPLVVINDQTEVRGPLIVNPPSYYTGKIFDVQLDNASLVSIDQAGNLSIAGTAAFLGPLTISVDSTTPALSIIQAGTGDLISLSRTGGGSFVINEDGFIVGTGTLKINEPGGQVWEMGVVAGKLTYTDAMTIAAAGTGASAIHINASDTTGGIDIDSGTGGVAMDTTGPLSLDSTGLAANLTLTANAADNATLVIASLNSGAGEAYLDINADEEITIDSSAGSISLDSVDNSNFIVTGSDKILTLAALGGGANQLILNSAGTSASAIDLDATGVVAGNAITIDTTDGGIALTAAGATNGDMTFTAQSSMALQFDNTSGFTLANDAGTTHLEIDTDGKLIIRSYDNKDIVLDAGTGSIMLKSQVAGDDIIQNIIPIFGFDLPAQTNSAAYKTVSRVLEADPFAAAPVRTTRKYKFIIRYADELSAGTSSWSVCPAATPDGACAETFTVPYSTTTDLDKGNVYTTGFITPTAYPWRLSVKTDGTNHIRVYQVFLAAYDQVD